MPPYDMGTWARALLDHAYDEETDYCPESYTLSVQDLERDLEKNLSPKTMKRSAPFNASSSGAVGVMLVWFFLVSC